MNARWLLLGFALLIPGHLPAADVYKWIDEEGAVHYGAQPPLGAETTRMKVSSGGGSHVNGAADSEEATSDGEDDAAQSPADGDQQSAAAEPPETDPEQAAKICADARRNLQIMETHGRVRERDGEGNVVVLTDEQKQARINEANELVEAYCK
jgi:hypothetical protein